MEGSPKGVLCTCWRRLCHQGATLGQPGEPEGVVGPQKEGTGTAVFCLPRTRVGGGSESQQKPPSRSAPSRGPGRRESRKPCRPGQEVWGWFPAWRTDETSTTSNLCPKRFLIYSL